MSEPQPRASAFTLRSRSPSRDRITPKYVSESRWGHYFSPLIERLYLTDCLYLVAHTNVYGGESASDRDMARKRLSDGYRYSRCRNVNERV